MKTRFGFVSNSSSCSFMIDDPRRAIAMLKKELGRDFYIPCSYDNIKFALFGTEDALAKIKDYVNDGTLSKSWQNDSLYELYGLTWWALIHLPAKMFKGVKRLDISAEDTYPGCTMAVRLLKELFKKNGLIAEDTGDVWSGLDDDDFLCKLLQKTILNREEKRRNEDEIQSEAIQ